MVVDGGYANREFLKPAKRAGFTAVARLRRDAKLNDLPPALQAGAEAGAGPPADLRQEPDQPGQAGRAAAGLAGGAGPDHQGPGGGPLGEDASWRPGVRPGA